MEGGLGSAIYSTVAAAGVVAPNGNGTVSTVGEVITATCTVAGTYGITFANVTGTLLMSYQLVFDVVTESVADRKYIDFGGMSGWFSDDVAGTNGVTRFAINVPTPATPLRFYKLSGGVGNTFSVRVISVKEYTGTHLTQPTTANKPLMRRGTLNLQVASEDLTNATYWSKTFGGTGTVPVVTAGQTDPDGGSTAFRVQANRGAGVTGADMSLLISGLPASTACMRSILIKSNTGSSQTLRLRIGYASTSHSDNCMVTGEWLPT